VKAEWLKKTTGFNRNVLATMYYPAMRIYPIVGVRVKKIKFIQQWMHGGTNL
jgi:hypothetical protein